MLNDLDNASKIKLFNDLYEKIDGFSASKTARTNLNLLSDSALTYGEVEFNSFEEIIQLAKPKKGEVFYDLGSGTGKPVIIAALCFDFSACKGIELLEPLYTLSIQVQKELYTHIDINQLPEIAFYHQDFIQDDFSSANIVFINATCFPAELWEKLIQKFNAMPKGLRIIINSKRIESPFFEEVHSGSHLMSWGMNSVRIYEKIK
jgi:hypothetical protein